MAVAVFLMLLLGQLPRIFASGFVIESNICGSDCIVYTDTYGHQLLHIDGYVVDKDLLCKALIFHSTSRSAIEAIRRSNCGLDLPLVNLPTKARRKLLQKDVEEKSTTYSLDQGSSREDESGLESLLTPKKLAMAASGLLILCCSFLCPCFRARRKETTHAVLSKDLSSIDSVSSIEVISASEKILGSPHRVPPSPRYSMSPKLSRLGTVHLNLSQIVKATHNFSPSLQIGEGGFGTVYKAQLQDGQVVAIKRAKKEHFENLQTEFSSEVELLAKIDHRNLVKLLGYVDKGNERLLITEYVPNGTLREHLDGQRQKSLDFNQRLEISIDIAHGLTYLHLYAGQVWFTRINLRNLSLTPKWWNPNTIREVGLPFLFQGNPIT